MTAIEYEIKRPTASTAGMDVTPHRRDLWDCIIFTFFLTGLYSEPAVMAGTCYGENGVAEYFISHEE